VGVPAPGDFLGSEAYVQTYTEMFGEAPGAWSPYTYDSVKFLAAGITGAGSTELTAVKTVLDKVKGWTGWTGDVAIDVATGDRNPATVVVTDVSDTGEFHVDLDWAEAMSAPF
jgi:branched-chain amino acid transport system substrate-binding protein